MNDSYIELKRDQIKIASGSEHVVTALSEEGVDRLLFYVDDRTKVSIRNKLIVYLLLYTGVRVSELVNIQLSDIDMLATLLIVRGKGGKLREISLRQDVLQLIKEYQKGERLQSKFRESKYSIT